jgi:hypothetical protein
MPAVTPQKRNILIVILVMAVPVLIFIGSVIYKGLIAKSPN